MSTDADRREALRSAYDADVERRAGMTPAPWRIDVIDSFLAEVPPTAYVIELGCGTGQLAQYVASTGRALEAIDLSPGNVAAARTRGVSAHVASFDDLPFPSQTFSAAFAMNSLLHVPHDELPAALTEIRRVLTDGAPLLVVVWGGRRHEGPFEHEWLEPPRYFSIYTDDDLLELGWPGFEIRSFRTIDTDESDLHAQVLMLTAV
jgi:SAM-dependent methyltransferase